MTLPAFDPLDDQNRLRAARIQQYTYSAPQRFFSRALAVVSAVTPGVMGIDCSFWQTVVDFSLAKAALISWAYIRALYGLSPDSKFPVHFPNAKGILPRTAYLYYKDDQEAKAQAKKLYDTCLAAGDIGDFQPVIDIETINNDTLTASKILTTGQEIEKWFGKKPLIYSGYYVIRDAVKGDKAWMVNYSLIIAAYPFTGWTDDLPQKVLNYPPLIPAPFKMWTANPDESLAGRVVGWQFTSSAPSSKFGASGNYLDLNWCSPAFQKQVLNAQPQPPPPPVGEPLMKFTNPNQLNIRSTPATTSTNDVGDLPKGSVITALEVRATDNNSVWVRFIPDPAWITKTVSEYWTAIIHDNQGILLNWVASTEVATAPPAETGEVTEAEFEALQEQVAQIQAQLVNLPFDWWNPSHVVVTTAPNGEKLQAYPNGSEAVMVKNGTLLMDLGVDWKGHHLFAANRQNIPVTGWLEPGEYQKL